MHNHRLKFLLFFVFFLSACSSRASYGLNVHQLAPESALTEEIRSAPNTVQEAYRFAIANPDILHEIPCYCGCSAVGHKNNYQCYVSEIGADGNITFDHHALG